MCINGSRQRKQRAAVERECACASTRVGNWRRGSRITPPQRRDAPIRLKTPLIRPLSNTVDLLSALKNHKHPLPSLTPKSTLR